MSFIRARQARRHGKSRGSSGHALTDVLGAARNIRVPVKKKYGQRSTYDRATQPLNERQAMVFALIGAEPVSRSEIVEATGLKREQVAGVLGALSARGLIRRAGEGVWVRDEH